jgi:hypothetical protein
MNACNKLEFIQLIKKHEVKLGYNKPAIFVRYNRVNLCTKITNLTLKSVRYNRVFVNNRVRYTLASQYLKVGSSFP